MILVAHTARSAVQQTFFAVTLPVDQQVALALVSFVQLAAIAVCLYILLRKRVLMRNIHLSIWLPLVVIGEAMLWFVVLSALFIARVVTL